MALGFGTGDGESTRATLERSVLIDGNVVRILDRRSFPHRVEWVEAADAAAVATAIRDMVTQSSGPYFATAAAMYLTARDAPADNLEDLRRTVSAAGELLVAARPTNNHPAQAVGFVLDRAASADSVSAYREAAMAAALATCANYESSADKLAEHAARLLDDGQTILTHCWMDSYLVAMVRAGLRQGKRWRWIATETRPYLQGARFTAHTLVEMSQDVTLITDGMAAAAMAPGSNVGEVHALITAADRVSMDGSLANKVGTLQHALAAHAYGIPFYGLCHRPDAATATGSDIVVENRDPREVFYALTTRVASALVRQAWYPAFDVTPPEFITSIVTDRGAFKPKNIADYFGGTDE